MCSLFSKLPSSFLKFSFHLSNLTYCINTFGERERLRLRRRRRWCFGGSVLRYGSTYLQLHYTHAQSAKSLAWFPLPLHLLQSSSVRRSTYLPFVLTRRGLGKGANYTSILLQLFTPHIHTPHESNSFRTKARHIFLSHYFM